MKTLKQVEQETNNLIQEILDRTPKWIKLKIRIQMRLQQMIYGLKKFPNQIR